MQIRINLITLLYINFFRSQTGNVEKYTNYNGPSSFSETISLPSQTDGSVSQGDDESLQEEEGGASGKPQSLMKKPGVSPKSNAKVCLIFICYLNRNTVLYLHCFFLIF